MAEKEITLSLLNYYNTKRKAQMIAADEKVLTDAKSHTSSSISTHNTNASAHNDIRALITALEKEVDALPTSGNVSSEISAHNTNSSAHNDIRSLISGLTTRLNALADSDDTTLDQLSEIVAYIKSNKSLIDSITTSKVNVTDIVDNLTTVAANKALSANQGTEIKKMLDEKASITYVDNAIEAAITAAIAASY